jgi:hypothetical protein
MTTNKQELVEKEKVDSNVINHPTISQPERLLEMAMQQGASLEQLEKFMDLKECHDSNEAKKAFTLALSNFKSEGVEIGKDKEVSYSGTFYTHASLGNIIATATPVLSNHGFSHRWETAQTDNTITVKCILTHALGHSESTQLQSAPDASGKKNAIQSIASAITYLERYTFLAITGLAVQDQLDDDGANAVEVEYINDGQLSILYDLINAIGTDETQFCKVCKVESLKELPIGKYDHAHKLLTDKQGRNNAY